MISSSCTCPTIKQWLRLPDVERTEGFPAHNSRCCRSGRFPSSDLEDHIPDKDHMKYVKDTSESILSTADDLIKDEKYEQAAKLLLKIPEYMCEYHDQAKQKYSSIEGIKAEKNKARKYQDALKKYDDKDYVAAQTGFMEIRDYKDSQSYLEKIGETLYDKAT